MRPQALKLDQGPHAVLQRVARCTQVAEAASEEALAPHHGSEPQERLLYLFDAFLVMCRPVKQRAGEPRFVALWKIGLDRLKARVVRAVDGGE